MGEAASRGTFEERRQQSIERQLDEAEVLVFLKADEGKVTLSTLTRDEPPKQDSPAVIFAAYLNANFEQLAGEAMALYMSHAQATHDGAGMQGTVVTSPAAPAILGADGRVARKTDDVELVLPAGAKR